VRRMAAGLLLPAAAIALAVAGLRVSVPGGVTALAAVTAGLVIAWALCAAASAQARERTPQWQLAAGAVTVSVAAGAARIADRASGGQRHAALAIATVAGLLVIAAIYTGFNEGPDNWQSLWTCAIYVLLGATLWRARAVQIPK